MPRSCSSGLESRYLILPANFGEMMPLVAMRASVREVLPWSWPDLAEMRVDKVRTTHDVGEDANLLNCQCGLRK